MMEPTNSKVPHIRFKGFEGEWEEKSLGEIASVYQPQTISQRDLTKVGFDVYGANGIIGKYSKFNHEEPQIAVTCRGNTCGTVNFTKEKSWITGNAMVVNVDENELVAKAFLFQQLSSQDLNYLITGSGQPQITGAIKSHKTWLCDINEQTAIGGYFREVDRLIGLHQKKHEKLVTLKKAMLQAMFPQPGTTTPKIRFKGFSGGWVEKKLGELATFSKGRGYSKRDLSASGTPIVLYGRLYVAYQTEITDVDTFVIEKKGSVKSTGKEVIVPTSGETAEDIARASAIRTAGILLGGDLNIVLPYDELDSVFLALTLSNGKPQMDLAKRAQGKTVVHVRKGDLESVQILFPKPAEQQKIGTYFRTLDSLISQHTLHLEKLKQIKSACLEKMFV